MIDSALNMVYAMENNLYYVLIALAVLWGINFLNWLLGSVFNYLGLYPRSWHGLIGIVVGPILHGHFNHLLFNSIPLFVFANLILLYGVPDFICVTVLVVLISGLLVWLFGRKAMHIGASGVVMGYWSYLLINAVLSQTAMALILGLVSIFYFGGLFMSLVDDDARVSVEGHLAGFVSGIAAYFLCKQPMVADLMVRAIS